MLEACEDHAIKEIIAGAGAGSHLARAAELGIATMSEQDWPRLAGQEA